MTSTMGPEPGPEAGTGRRFDVCMAELQRWREGAVREGALPAGAIKDVDFHRILTRGRRDERLVAKMLPAAYKSLAGAVVDLVMTVDPLNPPTPEAQPRPGPPPGRPSLDLGQPPSSSSRPAPIVQDQAGLGGSTSRPAPVHRVQAAAAPPEQPPSVTRDAADLATKFAALDYSEELGTPEPLRLTVANDVVKASWPAVDQSGYTVYRLVSGDDHPPYAPEWAELVAVTEDVAASDSRPLTSATRFLQVWSNRGADPADALRSQPRLYAEGALVAPVQDLQLTEDGGRVIGRWWVFPGVTRVHVHRLPIARAAQGIGDLQYRIVTDELNLSGFVDRDAVRGQSYLYQFYAEASIDGLDRLSPPSNRPITVSASIEPVNDLHAVARGEGNSWLFDLSWPAPPAGRVVVYRTQLPPAPGLDNGLHDEASLPGGGLLSELRLPHPTEQRSDGSVGMKEVPAPAGWNRVYFTPVTLLGGRARVGRAVSRVVIPDVMAPLVVERVDYQLLKFGWPGDAAAVAVDVGPPGKEPSVPVVGSAYYNEITRDQYRRLGALQFRQRLPAGGCSVHMVGVAFVNARRYTGRPTSVSYPGLLLLGYSIEMRRRLLQGPDKVLVRLWAERELTNCPPMVLVHNPERLPLHASDGEVLPVGLNVEGRAQPQRRIQPNRMAPTPSEFGWEAGVRGRGGFVRVFLDIPSEMLRHVALLDPPVSSLVLRP